MVGDTQVDSETPRDGSLQILKTLSLPLCPMHLLGLGIGYARWLGVAVIEMLQAKPRGVQ